MIVDAFLFAPDKKAAAAEIFRILRPGGRLVMTTWDYHRQPDDRPRQVADHRPLFRAAGLISFRMTTRSAGVNARTRLRTDYSPTRRNAPTQLASTLTSFAPDSRRCEP